MLSSRGLVALLLLVGSSACAGKSIDDAGEGGRGGTESGGAPGGGGGVSGKGGTGQGAGGSDFGGTSFGGGASAGAPNDCARFDDETPLFVTVQIYNQTPRAIHLGPTSPPCGDVTLFGVEDTSGTPLRAPGGCRTSCQVLHERGAGGCAAFCPGWDTVTLQPGEVLSTTWSGQYLTEALMPASCSGQDAQSSSLMCDRAMTISGGRYTFRAQAGTTLSCGEADGCRACSPNAQDGCTTRSAIVSGELKSAVTTAALSRPYGALGAPVPPPSSPGAELPAPPVSPMTTVQLFFTE
jgi:hypothetical protein